MPRIRARRNRNRNLGSRIGRPRRRGGFARVYRKAYAGQTHRFKQTCSKVAFSSSTVPTGKAFKFQLTDLDQVSTFTTLFDQYRIDKVVIKFVPRSLITSVAGNAQGANFAYWYAVKDTDDATTPATEAEMREHDDCKIMSYDGRIKSFTVYPHIASAVWGAGVFASFENKKSNWIDVASTTVEHYGFKALFPATAVAGTMNYDVFCDYYFSFKNVR